MSILDWFDTREKKTPAQERLDIPRHLWIKCPTCGETLFLKDLETHYKVCLKCSHHFRIESQERIAYTFDKNSFQEFFSEIGPKDFLGFIDVEPYAQRIKTAQKKTKKKDAVVIGTAALKGMAVNIGVMDFSFMGGSMGSVVGEKITRIVEKGLENKNAVIIFSSSGGARMQEGILSLMQMAKTSAALARLSEARIPFISVLCDPTTGGTSASFAMLGDINIAEPGALISFAGPRVIEQTIRQKLPKGFQRAEFLLEHGMVDRVIHRNQMRSQLVQILSILYPQSQPQKKA